MNPKVLFILHLPPPVHGASVMGKYIQDSEIINNSLYCNYINLSTAGNLTDIGKFKLKKITTFFNLLVTIKSQIRVYKPQLVYITPNAKGVPFYKDFIVVMLLKLMNCKIVAHYHNKGVKTKQNNLLDNFLYKCFFKNIKVILLSEILFQDIEKYVKRKDVFVCPNGIPNSIYKVRKKENDVLQLLYLSNLQKEKGIMDVLDACKILANKGYSFECNIIGGETSEMSSTDLTHEINIRNLNTHVHYMGKRYGEEKDLFYKRTDIFVFPTYYHNECFPVVLLEAMQHGCVCISTSEGGISDIIDNDINGFIIEKKNPTMLAGKIEILINNKVLMENMKKSSQNKFIDNFTLEKYEHKIHAILKQLINE